MRSANSLFSNAVSRRAGVWLLIGCAVFALQWLTPLPLFGSAWGRTPLFWLVLAPLSVLLASQTALPLRWLALHLRRQGCR